MVRVLLPLAALLALPGCAAAYESRIQARLERAGLSPSISGCVAHHLVDKLSRHELDELARAVRGSRERIGDMSVNQFIHTYHGVLDPRVDAVLLRAGLGCAIAG